MPARSKNVRIDLTAPLSVSFSGEKGVEANVIKLSLIFCYRWASKSQHHWRRWGSQAHRQPTSSR